MRKNDVFVAKKVNMRLTKVFMAIFALAERLPTSATLWTIFLNLYLYCPRSLWTYFLYLYLYCTGLYWALLDWAAITRQMLSRGTASILGQYPQNYQP